MTAGGTGFQEAGPCLAPRWLVRFRGVCLAVFGLVGVLALLPASRQDVGWQLGYAYFVLGALPSALVIAARHLGAAPLYVAFWHDTWLVYGVLIAIPTLPNAMGLILMSPLGVFAAEGALLLPRILAAFRRQAAS